MTELRIGLLGLGTVGTGTLTRIEQNRQRWYQRTGYQLRVIGAAVRRPERYCHYKIAITQDHQQIIDNADVVIEVMGGLEPARGWVAYALQQGKPVITANKALLATHGQELFGLAEQHGVELGFEAAVAGGIPIIRALRDSLSSHRINRLAGIINGTSNYVLTAMAEQNQSFGQALQAAQAKGYAEADPTLDINGGDAAHKLLLLSVLAFGHNFDVSVHQQGIDQLHLSDMRHAQRLGYVIKPLAIAHATSQGLNLQVQPTLVPTDCLLAQVNSVMNGVWVESDGGPTFYYGPGAGAEPTASAVVADLLMLMERSWPSDKPRLSLGQSVHGLNAQPCQSMDGTVSAHYLRLQVSDQAGLLARVSQTLADCGISIDTMQQPVHSNLSNQAEIVLITHPTPLRDILTSLNRLAQLDGILKPPVRLAVESFSK